MAATTLTTGPTLTDEQVNDALVTLPPLPDNVMVLLRHQQAQINALTTRIETLEGAP
ncbi:MAG: hypothetical protein ACR2G7_13995 [Acidimicrobiales bacterium]